MAGYDWIGWLLLLLLLLLALHLALHLSLSHLESTPAAFSATPGTSLSSIACRNASRLSKARAPAARCGVARAHLLHNGRAARARASALRISSCDTLMRQIGHRKLHCATLHARRAQSSQQARRTAAAAACAAGPCIFCKGPPRPPPPQRSRGGLVIVVERVEPTPPRTPPEPLSDICADIGSREVSQPKYIPLLQCIVFCLLMR